MGRRGVNSLPNFFVTELKEMVYGRDPSDIPKGLRTEYEAQFESIRDWKENLGSKSTYTFYNYLGDLIRFCRHVKMNPDELINLRAQTLTSNKPKVQHTVEKLVQRYVNVYAVEKSVTKAKSIRNAVASFYRHNYYRLGTIKISEVEEEDRPVKTLKLEELREVLKRSVIRERSIILTTASGGFREGTLVALKLMNIDQDDMEFVRNSEQITDVKILRTPVHIHAPKKTNKGRRNSYETFITGEAAQELVRWLKQRIENGEELTLQSHLYINAKRYATGIGVALKPAAIYHVVVRAGKRVDLKLTPTDLRDLFSKTLETKAKVSFSAVEQMMGHLSYFSTSAGSYKPFSVDELREFYKEAESFLTIETTMPTKERKMESEIDSLRDEVKRLTKVVKQMLAVNPEIKEQLEEQDKMMMETEEESHQNNSQLKLPEGE